MNWTSGEYVVLMKGITKQNQKRQQANIKQTTDNENDFNMRRKQQTHTKVSFLISSTDTNLTFKNCVDELTLLMVSVDYSYVAQNKHKSKISRGIDNHDQYTLKRKSHEPPSPLPKSSQTPPKKKQPQNPPKNNNQKT